MTAGVSWAKLSVKVAGDSSSTELRFKADALLICDARTRVLWS